MSGHATHGPSRAGRDLTCAAAAVREALYPDTSSAAAEWGTDSHWVLEEALNTSVEPLDMEEPVVLPYPEFSRVDWRDKATCAQVAYLYALGIKLQNKQCEILAETQVYPGKWIGVEDDVWGTADITIITNEVMEVVDFKSGRLHVDAGGPQNKLYLLGKALEYYVAGEVFPFAILRSTIVQPRGEDPQHVRSVDYTLDELYQWMIQVYKPAYDASIAPNPVATPSAEGCRWCKAKSSCRELAEQSLAGVTQINQPISDVIRIPDADTLNKQQKRMVLDTFPMLEAFYKAIREEAIADIEKGVGFPGYKMVAGKKGNRAWINADSDAVMKLLKNRKVPLDEYAPRILTSPTKVLGLIQDLKRKESVFKLTTQPPGGHRLVPDSNPNPEVNMQGGQRFGITDLDPQKETEAAAPVTETTAVPNCLL